MRAEQEDMNKRIEGDNDEGKDMRVLGKRRIGCVIALLTLAPFFVFLFVYLASVDVNPPSRHHH